MFKKFIQLSLLIVGVYCISYTNIIASGYSAIERTDDLEQEDCSPCLSCVVAGPSNLVNISTMRNPKVDDWCSGPCCEELCTCDVCPAIQPACITIPALCCGSVKCLHDMGIYVKNDPMDKLGFQPKRTPYMWWSLITGGALLIAGLNQSALMSDCSPVSDDPDLCDNPLRTNLIAAGATMLGMSVMYYGYRYILDCCRR
jgi:hypothetical protein